MLKLNFLVQVLLGCELVLFIMIIESLLALIKGLRGVIIIWKLRPLLSQHNLRWLGYWLDLAIFENYLIIWNFRAHNSFPSVRYQRFRIDRLIAHIFRPIRIWVNLLWALSFFIQLLCSMRPYCRILIQIKALFLRRPWLRYVIVFLLHFIKYYSHFALNPC